MLFNAPSCRTSFGKNFLLKPIVILFKIIILKVAIGKKSLTNIHQNSYIPPFQRVFRKRKCFKFVLEIQLNIVY